LDIEVTKVKKKYGILGEGNREIYGTWGVMMIG